MNINKKSYSMNINVITIWTISNYYGLNLYLTNINYFFCKNQSNYYKKFKDLILVVLKLNRIIINQNIFNYNISIITTNFYYNLINLKLLNNKLIILSTYNNLHFSNFLLYINSKFNPIRLYPNFLILLNNDNCIKNYNAPLLSLNQKIINDYSLFFKSNKFIITYIIIKHIYNILINVSR